ncbi:O-antigen polymerase [Metabacillus indicus]|uniref:O-antigen polymerase n=1 Tax=Metabacillus indicus TaxID=246786 RepID=UPI00316BEEB1
MNILWGTIVLGIFSQQVISYFLLVKKFRDFFNPILFTFIFIYFPFCISHLKLSAYQTIEYHPYFYIIMLVSSTLILYYSFFARPQKVKVSYELKVDNRLLIIVALNIVYVLSYFYENVYLSGSIIPLTVIDEVGDVHLNGLPIVREFNTVFRVLLPLLNYYLFWKTKKKRYLLLSVLSLCIPLSRGSRSAVINSIIIITVFSLRKINFKKILITMTTVIVGLQIAMYLGDYRRSYTNNSYGYEVGIVSDWLNTTVIGKIISWYYGYYALSLYNFNTSLLKWLNDQVFFLGLTNLNGLLSYFVNSYPTQSEFNSRIENINGAANVPTALYYYLIDFGVLGIFIIDFFVYTLLFFVYKRSMYDSFYRLCYCYLLLHILTFAFYSSFYAVLFYPLMILVLLFKKFFHKGIVLR